VWIQSIEGLGNGWRLLNAVSKEKLEFQLVSQNGYVPNMEQTLSLGKLHIWVL